MASTINVGILRALLTADTAQFDAAMTRAGQKTKDAASGFAVLKGALVGLGLQQAAKDAVHFGSQLTDLAAQTGIGVEALQRLNAVGVTVGVGMEQAARGIGMMQRNLIGDKGAKAAVESLGLSVDALLKLSPDEAFMAIAREIAKIPDPAQRTAAAFEVLGRQGTQLLPLMLADIEKLGAGTKVMSEDVVAGLDTFDDAWASTTLAFKTAVGTLIGSFGSVDSAVALMSTNIFTSFGNVDQSMERNKQEWTALKKFVLETVPAIYEAVKEWLVDKWVIIRDGIKGFWETIVKDFHDAKDEAIIYVRQLYEGVKMWLVDKFQAIVDGVKAKAGAVIGYFADMYDAVVGNSYVPDMMRIIQSEFGRLPSIMGGPTRQATTTVDGLFGDMFRSVNKRFEAWGSAAGNFIEKTIGGPLKSILGKIGIDVSSLLSGIITGGLAALFAMAVPYVIEGLKKLGDLIWNGLKKFGGWIKGLFTGGADRGNAPDVPSGGGPDPMNPNNPYVDDRGDPDQPGDPGGYQPDPNLPPGTSGPDWSHLQGMRGGTNGAFPDWGTGTPVMLHGREAVVPYSDRGDWDMGGSGGGTPIVMMVDGRVFGEVMAPAIAEAIQRVGVARV